MKQLWIVLYFIASIPLIIFAIGVIAVSVPFEVLKDIRRKVNSK